MKRFLKLIPVFVLGLLSLTYTGTMFGAIILSPLIASEPQAKVSPPSKLDVPKPTTEEQSGPTVVKHSKAFYAAVRMQAAKHLRADGHGILESRRLANKLTDEVIDQSIPDAEAVAGAKFGAIGDGTILQKIIDFFNSPTGKGIIDALIQILLHSIVPVSHQFHVQHWTSSLTAWNA